MVVRIRVVAVSTSSYLGLRKSVHRDMGLQQHLGCSALAASECRWRFDHGAFDNVCSGNFALNRGVDGLTFRQSRAAEVFPPYRADGSWPKSVFT